MFRRIVSLVVCIAFSCQLLQNSYAQGFSLKSLPVPGKMVAPAPTYMPLTLKGLVLHPENALKFDFLMDTGNSHLQGPALTEEARKIMTYFLTAMTMPEDDLWVNLSPYEQGKVIENKFGNTLMGRDLLAADYVLKQLTASLIYPEDELGKNFWKEIYAKTGVFQSDIPIETVNKVWIVPSEAVVWENNGKVIIIRSKLKVMLEEDYVALSHQKDSSKSLSPDKDAALKDSKTPGLINASQRTTASQAVRTIVLPVLEKQVNEGEHFAQLRQMYQAMILATWYKKVLKDSILSKVYANQKKIKGVDNAHPQDVEGIYQQYLEAFKKGVFNFIREDVDQTTGETIPRKYFSGGFTLRSGIVSLITALTIWGGSLTMDQREAINQSLQPVGETVVVRGLANEVNLDGQAILVVQKSSPDVSVDKEDVLRHLRIGNLDKVVIIGKQVVPFLIEALNDEYWLVRLNAVEALGEMNDKTALPVLTKALKFSDPWFIRRKAAEALAKLGGKAAEPALIEALKDQDWQVRAIVAEVLGEIEAETAVPALIEAWKNDPNKEVQVSAAQALRKITGSKFEIQAKPKLQASLTFKKFSGIISLATLLTLGAGNAQAAGFDDGIGKATVNVLESQPIILSQDNSLIKSVSVGSVNLLTENSSIYTSLLRGDVDVVVTLGDRSVSELIKLLGDQLVGEKAKEALVKLGEDVTNRKTIIKTLHQALVGFSFDITSIRAQQMAMRDVLSRLDAGWWQKMSDEGRWVVGLVALLGFGGAWYLKNLKSKSRLDLGGSKTDQSLSEAPEQLGGIALDPKLMNMQIRRDGNGTPLPLSQQSLDELNIQGFIPQVLSIQPVNLVDFLGLNLSEQNPSLARI